MQTRALIPTLLLFSISLAAAVPDDRVVLPAGVVPVHYRLALVPDAAKLSFTGSVRIDLDVKRPTREIVLDAADLAFQRVSLAGIAAAPNVSLDPARQTMTLHFAAPVSAGRHALSIDYTGKINQNAAGMFALDYDTPAGSKRALFTQLENSDARRLFPCWDEPGIKATFSLTAIVPAADMALSNTPVARTTKLKGGLARVAFAPTPRMSTYLLFFGVGDFERISRKVDGVDVGIVVKRGDTAQAQYALDVASQILPYYEDYFGVKYPLPKLDLIAGPGQSQYFLAMENWGAIFYFERSLIIDPRISSEADRRGVFLTIAHEMAHQWFGDLVTMAWWDDLWLNEGFAPWLSYKVMDHFHPEWKVLMDAVSAKEGAMQLDARSDAHPVITHIRDVEEANQAFDIITYEKGQSTIRMLEDSIGPAPFRAGVHTYIQAHAYGNTVTDDLWRELDKTTKQDIGSIAHDFTLQPGIPLIRVTSTATGLHLAQERFTADGSGLPATTWRVPVTVTTTAGTDAWRGLVTRDHPVDVPLPPDAVPLVNAGETGYYRTLYDAASFDKLAARFLDLNPIAQLGLVDDRRALSFAGDEPMHDFMQLIGHASPEMDPGVMSVIIQQLRDLNFLYEGLPGQAAFKAYARGLLRPVLAKAGWDPKPDEGQNAALIRTALLAALGKFDDPDVIREARARFDAELKGTASMSPDQRRAVFGIVADHADAATWDQLHALAKAAGSNIEKRQLYVTLGFARDPELVARAFALSLTDEAPVTARPSILAAAALTHPEMALDFFVAHRDVYDKFLEPVILDNYAARLAANARDTAILAKLRAYADAYIPADGRAEVVKTEMAVTENARVRAERLPDVDAWVAAHPE